MNLLYFFVGLFCGVGQAFGWASILPDFALAAVPTVVSVALLVCSSSVITMSCCRSVWGNK